MTGEMELLRQLQAANRRASHAEAQRDGLRREIEAVRAEQARLIKLAEDARHQAADALARMDRLVALAVREAHEAAAADIAGRDLELRILRRQLGHATGVLRQAAGSFLDADHVDHVLAELDGIAVDERQYHAG